MKGVKTHPQFVFPRSHIPETWGNIGFLMVSKILYQSIMITISAPLSLRFSKKLIDYHKRIGMSYVCYFLVQNRLFSQILIIVFFHISSVFLRDFIGYIVSYEWHVNFFFGLIVQTSNFYYMGIWVLCTWATSCCHLFHYSFDNITER